MKSCLLGVCGFAVVQCLAFGSTAQDEPYSVVARGPNHRVWQKVTYETRPDGSQVSHVKSYTELATGLHYQAANGQWQESREIVEPFPGGAVARHGQYQVIFANNLNTAGAIDIQTRDGKRLRSNVLGLAYYDKSTGQSVLIAQIQDSQGQVLGTNQVLYPNAFQGVKADLRYSYQKSRFEQDVILREQPPAPEAFGLSSASTELEVLTEFIQPPQEVTTSHRRLHRAAPDQEISWGTMRLGHGQAFDLGNAHNPRKSAQVQKQYRTINGRKILLETVPLRAIRADLNKLPLQAGRPPARPDMASLDLRLPPTPVLPVKRQPMRLAKAMPADPGYVLDYVEINGSTDDFTFQVDTTYYVSDSLEMNGFVTIEGGAVIKLATNPDHPIGIECWGGLACNTATYRPAIFTADHDDSVGEVISSAYPAPGTYWAAMAGYSASDVVWHDVHVKFAHYGLDATTLQAHDCQFVNCLYPILLDLVEGGACSLTNILVANAAAAISGMSFNAVGTHLTVAGCTNLTLDWDSGSSSTLALTNSLMVNVATGGDATITTNACAWATDTGGTVFQTVGGGAAYLASNSIYREAGSTNLDPALLANLATKTTQPPVVFAGTQFHAAQTLSPQPLRNTGRPDLGYHYPALDYVFGGCDLYTNLTVTAGAAVAWFEAATSASGELCGLALNDGAVFTCAGTATAPCWLTRFNAVQEGINGNWNDRGYIGGIMLNGTQSPQAPKLIQSFSRWFNFEGMAPIFRDNWAYGEVAISHSEFYGSGINSFWGPLYFTNCLFYRCSVSLLANVDAGNLTIQNSTFYNGGLSLYRFDWQSPSSWVIQNNAFDGTAFSGTDDLHSDPANTAFNYNAYNTNNLSWQSYVYIYSPIYGALLTNGPQDVAVGNFNWRSSWLGDFYLPSGSALIDVGSTTANQLGLYHFTTQTSQVKEANSSVDIGYHYVAVNASGNPFDTYGDGIPDYLADPNCDGMADGWELHYFGTNNVDPNGDYDGDGISNLQEYLDGTDPNKIQFSLETSSFYVNHLDVSVQFAIRAGVPHDYAIYFNQTPTTNWQPFTTTNLTLNLGSTDGVYEVVVGLKGLPADAQQTWQFYRFTLDRMSPLVSISNPGLTNGAATVSKPYLQLLGAADKPVARLVYDITNAAGCFTNLDAFVSDQQFDSNKFDFTTNFFQAYDVPLTTNDNFITLQVTDRAGNTTTTNFNVVLEYASATNPPVVNLIWPLPGTAVSGSTCTIRGTMSDETGTIVAQVVNGVGETNIVTGLIERNNQFWIEDVPLSGTNLVTIAATNAAGVGTNLVFIILPSDIDLTIISTPTGDDLYKPFGTVSGTVTPGSSVTINGVPACVDGSGNWSTNDVPIRDKGTVTFDVVAVAGARVVESSKAVEMDRYVEIVEHHTTKQIIISDTAPLTKQALSSTNKWVKNYWTVGSSNYQGNVFDYLHGSAIEEYSSISTDPNGTNKYWQILDFSWTLWEGFCQYATSTESTGIYPITKESEPSAMSIPDDEEVAPFVQHYYADTAHYHWNGPAGGWQNQDENFTVTARTQVKLSTGGKSGVKRDSLFCINAWAKAYDWSSLGNWVESDVADKTQLRVMEKQLGADGNLWVVLPDNTSHDITVSAPKKHYNAWATPEKFKLAIKANEVLLDPNAVVSNAHFCVGQHISFDLSGLPDGATAINFRWDLSGTYVNDHTNSVPGGSSPNSSENYFKNQGLLNNATLTNCWWVSGGFSPPLCYSASVTCDLIFTNGRPPLPASASGLFTMHRPKIEKFVSQIHYECLVHPHPTNAPASNDQMQLVSTGATNTFTLQINSLFGGQAFITQTFNGYATNQQPSTNLCDTHGSNYLDNAEQFDLSTVNIVTNCLSCNLMHLVDFPYILCVSNTADHTNFKDYIRFNPNPGGNGIAITLGVVKWHITADTYLSPIYGTGDQDYVPFPTVNGAIYLNQKYYSICGSFDYDGPLESSEEFPDWVAAWINY